MQNYRTPDSEDLPANTSENEHFQLVVERACSRRGFLKSGIGLSAAVFLAGPLAVHAKNKGEGSNEQASSLLGFSAIPISTDDTVKIAAGYTAAVFAPWGTPLFADAPAWKTDGGDDAAAQA
ncbi:MAG: alkaline phosphatase PhoX, partial [Pollutimonas bauzanensis]